MENKIELCACVRVFIFQKNIFNTSVEIFHLLLDHEYTKTVGFDLKR